MSGSEECQIPVRDGHTAFPSQTAPEEMYWMRHMSREELMEKLVNLREDFYTVKKFSRRQEDKIRKLQTKLRKFISDKKKDDKEGTSSSLKEMEYQEAIETHQLTIRDLRLKTQHLEKKLKLANVQLSSARKNRPMLFRHVGPKVDSGLKHRTPPPPSRPSPSPHTAPPPPPTYNESPSHTPSPSTHHTDQVMPERIREVLEEARERIEALESEKDNLQDQLEERDQAAENAEYEAKQRISLLEEEVSRLKEELHQQGVREERSSVAAVKAERESHTLSARTVALEEQLLVTEEKVAAEKSRKDALHSELERMTEKLLGVENQLRGVQEDQQKTAGKLLEINEKNRVLENENHQLKSENDSLTSLNLNFDHKGLAKENETLKAQISHLESALESDLSERGSFLQHMTQDKEDLVRAEHEIKGLKDNVISLQQQLEDATTKLNVFDKAGLLKLPDKDPTLLPPRVSAPSPKEFERLREAHSELQLLYREKSRELEQLCVTLSSHSSTYQALQTQVSKVTQESMEKEKLLNMTIRSLEDTIKRRDERCGKLETQILTLTDEGVRDRLGDQQGPPSPTQTVGLGKHDNLLEFHIDRIVFEMPQFSHLKTFVSWTVPFSLEDPLQHTNAARGTDPHYNYSALYKFQVNNRNLMSLKEDTVTVCVYVLLDSGHPAKVGECGLTFQEILHHPRNTLHGTVPVVLVHDETQHLDFIVSLTPGIVIGSMSYWFRLQRPSEDAIALYLRNSNMISTNMEKLHHKMENMSSKSIRSPAREKATVKEASKGRGDSQMTKMGEQGMQKGRPPLKSTLAQKSSPTSPDTYKTGSVEETLESLETMEENSEECNSVKSDSPVSQASSQFQQTIKTRNVKQGTVQLRRDSVNSASQSERKPESSKKYKTGSDDEQRGIEPEKGKSKAETLRKPKSNSDSDDKLRNMKPEKVKSKAESSRKSKSISDSDEELRNTKLKISDSDGSSEGNSAGTYSVLSPKVSHKASESSTSSTFKTIKRNTKRSGSESSFVNPLKLNSKAEKSSSSSLKSVSARSSLHKRNIDVAELKPTTSKTSPHMDSRGPSRSQVMSSESSSDTSLDEEVISDSSHSQDVIMSLRKGPLPNTVGDFWRMVVECEVQVIIMASNETEGGKHKCECYWVNREEEERQFGNVSVSFIKARQVCQDFMVRTLKIKYTTDGIKTEERTICQFHYVLWPDHGVPETVRPLLDMVRLVRDCQASETLPVLVHCSAGCGRTGTICAIDYVWGLLRAGRLSENLDLFGLVKEMRRQRVAMVQTLEQYILLHRAVRELFKERLRVIDAHPYENIATDGTPLILHHHMESDYEELLYHNIEKKGESSYTPPPLSLFTTTTTTTTKTTTTTTTTTTTSTSVHHPSIVKLKEIFERRCLGEGLPLPRLKRSASSVTPRAALRVHGALDVGPKIKRKSSLGAEETVSTKKAYKSIEKNDSHHHQHHSSETLTTNIESNGSEESSSSPLLARVEQRPALPIKKSKSFRYIQYSADEDCSGVVGLRRRRRSPELGRKKVLANPYFSLDRNRLEMSGTRLHDQNCGDNNVTFLGDMTSPREGFKLSVYQSPAVVSLSQPRTVTTPQSPAVVSLSHLRTVTTPQSSPVVTLTQPRTVTTPQSPPVVTLSQPRTDKSDTKPQIPPKKIIKEKSHVNKPPVLVFSDSKNIPSSCCSSSSSSYSQLLNKMQVSKSTSSTTSMRDYVNAKMVWHPKRLLLLPLPAKRTMLDGRPQKEYVNISLSEQQSPVMEGKSDGELAKFPVYDDASPYNSNGVESSKGAMCGPSVFPAIDMASPSAKESGDYELMEFRESNVSVDAVVDTINYKFVSSDVSIKQKHVQVIL